MFLIKGCIQMKSYFFIFSTIFTLSSCNVIQSMTGGETKLSADFFRNQVYQVDLTPELFAFWRLEEEAYNSRFDTYGNYPLNDTVSGGIPRVKGVRGSAADITGLSSGTTILEGTSVPFNKAVGDSLAFSFWVYFSTNLSGGCADTRTVFMCSSGYIALDNLDCQNDSADIDINFGSSTTFNNVADFAGGQWHHFVINIDDSTALTSLYVDGAFLGSNTHTATAISSAYIGLGSNGTGISPLNGKLDSFGIWNRLLETHEIEALYHGHNNLD